MTAYSPMSFRPSQRRDSGLREEKTSKPCINLAGRIRFLTHALLSPTHVGSK